MRPTHERENAHTPPIRLRVRVSVGVRVRVRTREHENAHMPPDIDHRFQHIP